MKKYIKLFTALVAGCALLASCATREEEFSGNGREIKFSASVGTFQVKATDTAFERADAVGLSTIEGITRIDNARLVWNGNALEPESPIYWNDRQSDYDESLFIATYPYAEGRNNYDFEFCVNADQSTHALYTASDLMFASALSAPADGSVHLNFVHKLSKIILKIDNMLDKEEIAEVFMGNVNGLANVKADGNVYEKGDYGTIKAGKVTLEDGSPAWALIIVPQYTNPRLMITTTSGKQYTYDVQNRVYFASGRRYLANVVIDASSIATDFTSDVIDWVDDNDIQFGQEDIPVAKVWSLIGEFSAWDGDVDLFKVSDSPEIWELDGITLPEGGVKFRGDHIWGDLDLGAPYYDNFEFIPNEFLPLIYFGANIIVPAGTYDIFLYPQDPAVLFIPVETPDSGPWVPLGTGHYYDSFTFPSRYCAQLSKHKYAEVQIFQNNEQTNQFKIVDAYTGYYEYSAQVLYEDAVPTTGPNKEIILEILPAGTILTDGSEPIVASNLVWWEPFNTETYDGENDITCYHPSIFSTVYSTEDTWNRSRVESYQNNGLPAIITLSPAFYIDGLGGWAYFSQTDEYNIQIAFPGVPVYDYSTSVNFEGLLTAQDGNEYVVATAELGEDVEFAKAVVVPEHDAFIEASNLINTDAEGVVTIYGSGEYNLPLYKEVSEYYMIIIVPFAGGEARFDDASYDFFQFKDFSVSLTLDEPTIAPTGAASITATVEFGKDTEGALVALAPGNGKDGIDAAYALILDGDSSVKELNESGQVTFNIEDAGYYTIMAVSVAAGELWNYDYKSFSYYDESSWEFLGTGFLTDDIVCPIYGFNPVTVPCNVYGYNYIPGLYRVTDFQPRLVAALFEVQDEELEEYEGIYWRNSPLIIDATDPDNVFIEEQDYGVCLDEGDGFFGVTSLYRGEPFSVGILADGVISFPTPKGMLCTIDGDGYYYADINGAFQVVLPSTEGAPALAPRSNARASGRAKAEKFAPVEKAASKQLKPSAVSIARGKVADFGAKGKSAPMTVSF